MRKTLSSLTLLALLMMAGIASAGQAVNWTWLDDGAADRQSEDGAYVAGGYPEGRELGW